MEVWIYGYIYVYIDVWKCGYVDISLYGYMYLWIYGYMDRVHDVFHDVVIRLRVDIRSWSYSWAGKNLTYDLRSTHTIRIRSAFDPHSICNMVFCILGPHTIRIRSAFDPHSIYDLHSTHTIRIRSRVYSLRSTLYTYDPHSIRIRSTHTIRIRSAYAYDGKHQFLPHS